MEQKNIIKVWVHDWTEGLIYLGSVAAADQFGINFIFVAVATAILQILSPVTKFCPVYPILNKIMPDSTSIKNGKST